MTMSRLASTSTTLAFAALLAACGCGNKPSGTTPTGGGDGSGTAGGPTGDDVPPGTMDISKLGADCRETNRCEAGSCMSYYGIAGPSGPQFRSCEVACVNGKGPCPAGTACITIADGPGSVCRPTESNPPVEP